MDLRPLVLFLHLLAVVVFMAGYIATNACTEFARHATNDDDRRAALAFSNRFDRLGAQYGGTGVIVTGIAAFLAYGYQVSAPWLIASSALFVGLPLLGILYWAPLARSIDAAEARGDGDEAQRLLTRPGTVALSRIENVAVVAIIALMVFRPG